MPLHLYEVLPNVTVQSTTGELDVYDVRWRATETRGGKPAPCTSTSRLAATQHSTSAMAGGSSLRTQLTSRLCAPLSWERCVQGACVAGRKLACLVHL